MIKINFIGQKDSGKSISCYVLANCFSKKQKVAILNLDLFSKYKQFFKKTTKQQKIKIKDNLDLFDIDPTKFDENGLIEKVKTILASIEKEYEIIFVDHTIAYNNFSSFLLTNSDFILCPFKIDKFETEYKNKIINFFIENQISFKNFKFLAILTQDFDFNAKKMLDYRKELSILLFENFISHYSFNEYKELFKTKNLIKEYEQIYKNIKKLIYHK